MAMVRTEQSPWNTTGKAHGKSSAGSGALERREIARGPNELHAVNRLLKGTPIVLKRLVYARLPLR